MKEPVRILMDGRMESSIPATNRGLHYGDGVFRTMLVREGRPVYLSAHLNLLARDSARLGIDMPDRRQLEQRCKLICEGNGDGVLKVMLTRSGGRGYRPASAHANEILLLYQGIQANTSLGQTRGVTVRVCNTRLSINPALAGIKHLNRLEQVMARAEWDDENIDEGLMLDTTGHVIEATASNLFLARNGSLYTPDLSGSGVAGLMREMIIEAASAYTTGMNIDKLSLEDCMAADELFLCNSIIGIWPVRSLLDSVWPVPGVITRKLQQHFENPGA